MAPSASGNESVSVRNTALADHSHVGITLRPGDVQCRRCGHRHAAWSLHRARPRRVAARVTPGTIDGGMRRTRYRTQREAERRMSIDTQRELRGGFDHAHDIRVACTAGRGRRRHLRRRTPTRTAPAWRRDAARRRRNRERPRHQRSRSRSQRSRCRRAAPVPGATATKADGARDMVTARRRREMPPQVDPAGARVGRASSLRVR